MSPARARRAFPRHAGASPWHDLVTARVCCNSAAILARPDSSWVTASLCFAPREGKVAEVLWYGAYYRR